MSKVTDDLVYTGVEAVWDHARGLLEEEEDQQKARALRAIVRGCKEVMDKREKELKELEVSDEIDREVAGLNK